MKIEELKASLDTLNKLDYQAITIDGKIKSVVLYSDVIKLMHDIREELFVSGVIYFGGKIIKKN